MWQSIKTIFLVTFITGVIWLYAESEVVNRHEIDLDLQFTPPPGRHIEINPTHERVRVVFQSSTTVDAELDRRTHSQPVLIEVDDDPNTPDGQKRTLFLKDLLAFTPPIKDMGLNILEVQPPNAEIDVQHLVTKKLPVALANIPGVQWGPFVSDPAEVEVTAPANVASHWDKNIAVEARPDPEALAGLDASHPLSIDVPVAMPANAYHASEAALATTIVHVTLTVRKETDTITLPSVPVVPWWPASESDHLWIKLDDDQTVLHDVVLTGPSDVIDQIRQDKIKISAELDLTADELENDLGKDSVTAQPTLHNPPPGVTLDAPLPSVRFKVVKKG